jgi:hypothetical protein
MFDQEEEEAAVFFSEAAERMVHFSLAATLTEIPLELGVAVQLQAVHGGQRRE